MFAIFHGGPADGKELKIVVSNEVIIPVMKPIKAEFTLGNSETPEYFHGYDKHFYRIRHVIYDYLEEKSKLE